MVDELRQHQSVAPVARNTSFTSDEHFPALPQPSILQIKGLLMARHAYTAPRSPAVLTHVFEETKEYVVCEMTN